MPDRDEILAILDDGARSFRFPALDNGYVYLAATRLSVHGSAADWAFVFEVFGFSPRNADPDLQVTTFASRPHERDAPETFASRQAYEAYLANNPNSDSRFFHPLDDDAWQDPEGDLVAIGAGSVRIRGSRHALPAIGAYADHGIRLVSSPRVATFELCRYLADVARDDVLATPVERRVSVAPGLDELLVLDGWNHPDIVMGERPSQSETFQQLADVVVQRDATRYRPSSAANTHWRNWPGGGQL
jgi:hypothetical protein